MSRDTVYISVDNIITDASQELRDPEQRKVPYATYRSMAQRAVQELCYDVPWDERTFDVEVPGNRILELPDGVTSLLAVWLYNGDACNVSTSTKVFIKPNMVSKGGGGYLANNKTPGGDLGPFPWFGQSSGYGVVNYAGISDGKMYLSENCLSYQRIMVRYSGIGMECFGEDFQVPGWAREAVTDFIILKAARMLMQDDMRYYPMVVRDKEVQVSTGNPNGTWCRALGRWNRMDQKERDDILVRTTRLGRGLMSYI